VKLNDRTRSSIEALGSRAEELFDLLRLQGRLERGLSPDFVALACELLQVTEGLIEPCKYRWNSIIEITRQAKNRLNCHRNCHHQNVAEGFVRSLTTPGHMRT
jgi:hypothetical protein